MFSMIMSAPAGGPSSIPVLFDFGLASLLPAHPLALIPIVLAVAFGVTLSAARSAVRRHEAEVRPQRAPCVKRDDPPALPYAA